MAENLPLPVHLSLPFLETTLMNNMEMAVVGAESMGLFFPASVTHGTCAFEQGRRNNMVESLP